MTGKLIVFFIIAFISFNYLSNVKAQDTFGPICDDVTVTCVPTETPAQTTEAPSPTELPTDTPAPPPPTELPRAGTTENVSRMVIIAMSLIIAGVFSQFAFAPRRK